MPLILPGNVGSATAATGFNVANSVRFQNAQLGRTSSSTSATNIDKYTISVWVKRSKLGADQNIISLRASSYYQIYFKSDDTIRWQEYLGGSSKELITNRKFRDVGAWYNLIFRYDSSLGTAGDRMRMYVNGVEETSFATDSNPAQNTNGHFGVASTLSVIGDDNGDGREYFGYMCEFMGVDGQSLAPTEFGEFDSDNGIWKPIDISGITQGVHGFYLKFEDSSNLGVATLGSNWTGAGLAATDQSTDTCTNNFATWNSLQPTNAAMSEGNLVGASSASSGHYSGISSIGVSSGKWYFECKQTQESTANEGMIGVIIFYNTITALLNPVGRGGGWGMQDGNRGFSTDSGGSGSTTDNFHAGWTDDDIIGIALDIDNSRVYYSKNGSWNNSGSWNAANPTTSQTLQNALGDGTYFFMAGDASGSNNCTWSANFGSPAHAISSGNTDGNGYGNFEYAVPSGYFSLNTKNLAKYG